MKKSLILNVFILAIFGSVALAIENHGTGQSGKSSVLIETDYVFEDTDFGKVHITFDPVVHVLTFKPEKKDIIFLVELEDDLRGYLFKKPGENYDVVVMVEGPAEKKTYTFNIFINDRLYPVPGNAHLKNSKDDNRALARSSFTAPR